MCPKCPGHSKLFRPHVAHFSLGSIGPNAGSYSPPRTAFFKLSKIIGDSTFFTLIFFIYVCKIIWVSIKPYMLNYPNRYGSKSRQLANSMQAKCQRNPQRDIFIIRTYLLFSEKSKRQSIDLSRCDLLRMQGVGKSHHHSLFRDFFGWTIRY